jgi:hypothetical protein
VRDYRQYLSSHPPPQDSAAVQKELDDMIEEKKKETKAAATSAEYSQRPYNNFYNHNFYNPNPASNPSSSGTRPFRADNDQYNPKNEKPSAGSGSAKQWRNGGSTDEDDDPYKFSGYNKVCIHRKASITVSGVRI